MRKFMLIAAISLVSAAAHAGPSRGLSLMSSEPPLAAEQPKTEQTADKGPVVADKAEVTAKPKTKHASTEARVVYELHRHGIYW